PADRGRPASGCRPLPAPWGTNRAAARTRPASGAAGPGRPRPTVPHPPPAWYPRPHRSGAVRSELAGQRGHVAVLGFEMAFEVAAVDLVARVRGDRVLQGVLEVVAPLGTQVVGDHLIELEAVVVPLTQKPDAVVLEF